MTDADVEARLRTLAREGVVERIWERDHTVWKPDPTEISDRLGWLDLPSEARHTMLPAIAERLAPVRRRIAAGELRVVVLLGMGGSSLAPEVMHAASGLGPDGVPLVVLDSTDPAQVLAIEREHGLDGALFVVASKSGGTIETRSQFDYFWSKLPDPSRYVVITDPGSSLEAIAAERGIAQVFLNPADIGGRYSALSYFGLVPGALMGHDLETLLASAEEMAAACRKPADDNPGARLGAFIAEGALAGRDKLTLVLPPEMAALGPWVEQLVAESTGKEGRGVLPIEGEALGPPEVYGNDRQFVALGKHAGLDVLERAGHPVLRIPYEGRATLGGEFFRWEFATAIAGHVLGIQPFDQPNVQEAKDATARVLAGHAAGVGGALTLDAALASLTSGDYIAITAFVPRTDEMAERLGAIRMALRDRHGVATTVGFGPRFLHSTGQYHKGGPNSGVFLQVLGEDPEDVAIPGQPYTFGQLKAAQADGDLAALVAHGRRVARVTLEALQAEAAR